MKYCLALSSLIFFCFGTVLFGQVTSEFVQEIRFVNHLLSKNSYNEALFVLEKTKPSNSDQADTLNYFTGWILYSQKDLKTSSHYLSMVSDKSPWYEKSRFYAAYNLSFLYETSESIRLLRPFENSNLQVISAMHNFQLAGIALLDRRMTDFESYSNAFKGAFGVMAREEERLKDYHIRIQQRSSKSPYVAGFLSAAVPGLGKIYAGKPSEGIAGFMYVGAMMAATYDFYNRKGPQNPFFIASACLTSIFYIGNIWGSVATINRTNREFNHEINQRILLDMHIPLRNLFP